MRRKRLILALLVLAVILVILIAGTFSLINSDSQSGTSAFSWGLLIAIVLLGGLAFYGRGKSRQQ